MKVKVNQRKSKWHSPTVTITGISRELLSLILSHAADNLEKEIAFEKKIERRSGMNHEGLLDTVKKVDDYINNEDTVVHLTPLEVE